MYLLYLLNIQVKTLSQSHLRYWIWAIHSLIFSPGTEVANGIFTSFSKLRSVCFQCNGTLSWSLIWFSFMDFIHWNSVFIQYLSTHTDVAFIYIDFYFYFFLRFMLNYLFNQAAKKKAVKDRLADRGWLKVWKNRWPSFFFCEFLLRDIAVFGNI